MSRYSFRKPTIGQQADLTIAAIRGDMGVIAHLLDALAIDDILDLPFTELAVVAKDYASAMQAWQEERIEIRLPNDMLHFLAGLSARESTEEEDD